MSIGNRLTIEDIEIQDKRILVRVDFNVPLTSEGEVDDDTRIVATIPTLKFLIEGGARSLVLMSHLGRPSGKIVPSESLRPVVPVLEKLIGKPVIFIDDCMQAGEVTKNPEPGTVILLENLRFYGAEEGLKNSQIEKKVFEETLGSYGDIYVNDAFGTAHRAHASTTIIAQFFPEKKCFGYLLAQEIESIEKVMKTGEKPILAVLGGAKVSSKITIIENILDKVDHLIIGGGMSFTFIKAQGGKIGNSICEDDKQELALEILKQAKAKNVQVHIPVDVVAADAFSNDANTQIVDITNIPDGWEGVDAGPKSIAMFHDVVMQSKTILWNGPLGVFEMEKFAKGTIELGNSIAEATKNGAFSLVGGGDSVAAVKQFGFEDKVSYVSTGGGAMLESLEGKTLPGIAAILE